MGLTGIVVMFVIFWWLVFFTVLPIGVRGQYEDDAGTTPGTEEAAPANPRLARKALWATLGSAAITAAVSLLARLVDLQALLLEG